MNFSFFALITVSLLFSQKPLRAVPENYPATRAWLEKEATHGDFMPRGDDNVRYLEVSVNGLPAVALVDTGADACWLLKSRHEGLKAPKSLFAVRGYKWKTKFAFGSPATSSDVFLMGGDFPSLERDNIPGRRAIDLVCGQPFFQAFPGLVDFAGDRYWVYRNPLSSKILKSNLAAAGWHIMDFETVGHYHFFRAKVSGQEVRFLADTGTGHTLIQDSLATQLGFPVERIGGKLIGLTQQTGILSSCIAREVDFGPVHFTKLPVIVSDEVRLLGKTYPGGPPVRGILGAELMRASGALYDAANGWMAWPAQPFDPLTYGDVNPISGPSREKLPAQVREASDIVMVKISDVKYANMGIGTRTKRMATIEMRVQHPLKGAYQPGETVSLRVEVSANDEKDRTLFAEYQGRKSRRLLLLKRDSSGRPELVVGFDFWSDRYMLLKQLVAEAEAK